MSATKLHTHTKQQAKILLLLGLKRLNPIKKGKIILQFHTKTND